MSEVTIRAKEINLTTGRAADVTWEVTYEDSNGNAIDISNAETQMTLRKDYGEDIIIKKNITAGNHEDGPNGIDRFTFTDSEMDPDGFTEHEDIVLKYSIRLKLGTNDQYDAFYGTYTIEPTVSEVL